MWRIRIWRMSKTRVYEVFMLLAVAVHCCLCFWEAPSPILEWHPNITYVDIFDSSARPAALEEVNARLDTFIVASGVCILLHFIDAMVMVWGEGMWAAVVTARKHRRDDHALLRQTNDRDHINKHIFMWCLLTCFFILDWTLVTTTRCAKQGTHTHRTRNTHYRGVYDSEVVSATLTLILTLLHVHTYMGWMDGWMDGCGRVTT